MDGIDIPSYFLCPISLQIMRDPVTLCTGITYDRDSIERWLFTRKNNTCPMTKQFLTDAADLTPNHTLRRLIQAWCTANASNGVERIPTPKPPVEKTQIAKLLDDTSAPQSQMRSLQRLRSIVGASDRNRRCVEFAGAPDCLVSIIIKNNPASKEECLNGNVESTSAVDEAVNILNTLKISRQGLAELVARNGDLIESLTAVLQRSNYQSRAYATFLLKSIFESVNPDRLMSLREQIFVEIVKVLRDRISYKAMKAALRILAELCPWGRNRIKAVDADGVSVLIELLLDEQEKRPCEMMLVVLDQLCGCAEGRAKLLEHRAGIAMVSKKIFRVSLVASERAVRILYSVSKFSATQGVLQEMLQLGVVSKLCWVLHVDCGVKTKEKAKEILRLHSRTWKNSPCIAPQLQASYPSSSS